LNGIFGSLFCFETFKVDKVYIDKAGDNAVFNTLNISTIRSLKMHSKKEHLLEGIFGSFVLF